jgi:hypothetical protein
MLVDLGGGCCGGWLFFDGGSFDLGQYGFFFDDLFFSRWLWFRFDDWLGLDCWLWFDGWLDAAQLWSLAFTQPLGLVEQHP